MEYRKYWISSTTTKDTVLQIRINAKDKAALVSYTSTLPISMSEFIRRIIIREIYTNE